MASGAVGIIVNPVAGKDIRRLVSGADHTSDSTKIGIVARVVAGAIESGASRIVLADDPHRLARRAVDRLNLGGVLGEAFDGVVIELLSDHVSGTRDDTMSVAAHFSTADVDVVIALGGDGTCRDVTTGWPDAPLIAISTGTNNVYPAAIDGTSAGVAAGLVACGAIAIDQVSRVGKRIVVHVDTHDGREPGDLVALVDIALIDTTFVGARAVRDPRSIRSVVAAIADPASTGLSSVAGRVHPVGRWEPGGVVVHMLPSASTAPPSVPSVPSGVRRVRVPLSPGTFDTVDVLQASALAAGERVEVRGPGVLAFDGERDLAIGEATTVSIHIEEGGPRLIDVHRVLCLATQHHLFDLAPTTDQEYADAG